MAEIYYARVDEFWKKEEKYRFLEEKKDISNIDWKTISPDKKYNWLIEGLSEDFETFLPLGSKQGKSAGDGEAETVFKTYSRGVCSNGDAYVYNYDKALWLTEIAKGNG